MSQNADTSALVERLRKFGTCQLADACQQLGISCFITGVALRSPLVLASDETHRTVGPAHTVQFVPSKGVAVKAPSSHHVDVATAGSVLVLSAPPSQYGCWGGLMSRRAKKLGCAGVIVDGNCRDLEESRGLSFPVFSKDTSVHGVSGMLVVSAINSPITVGGILVRPGDLIHGDINGVISIPRERVEEVLHVCGQLAGMDDKVAEALDQGVSIQEAFKKFRTKVKPLQSKL
eukprot:GILI01022649.1.p1 GENE.GILI01022649.1~~GILI01022649.1.p1  ORF type:complete len:232 (+),score=55.80 GILI01022649.1:56-751(+)